MTPQEFTNWLDGYLSNNQKELNEEQTKTIKSKLDLVFNKVTPDLSRYNIGVSNILKGSPILDTKWVAITC